MGGGRKVRYTYIKWDRGNPIGRVNHGSFSDIYQKINTKIFLNFLIVYDNIVSFCYII